MQFYGKITLFTVRKSALLLKKHTECLKYNFNIIFNKIIHFKVNLF